MEKCFWFGTERHAEWIRSPSRGATFSPVGWGESGTYLNGGGWVTQSASSHREYVMEWTAASSVDAAMRMQAYRDGVYSGTNRSLMYFVDPFSYGRNILPKQWAHPALLAGSIGAETIDLAETGLPDEVLNQLRAPYSGLRIPPKYNDGLVPEGPGPGVVYQQIPEGYDLLIAAGISGVYTFVRPQLEDRSYGEPVMLSPIWTRISDARGFLLYLKNSYENSADVFFHRAILVPTDAPNPEPDSTWEWSPGMGNSGCRFVGEPTYVPTGPFDGGMAGYAATLKEVGDWL